MASIGTISSAGVGSGLDVDSIITKLMAIEQRPLKLLQTAASTIQTKISAYGSLQSAVASFRDAALALTYPSAWSATTATSSDAASAAVSTGLDAVPGSYTVTVQQLATAQSVASGSFGSSSATVGAGTLHIDIGTWAPGQTQFNPKADSTGIDITVSASDTLASVRDKINAAGAGVTASILTDASGARLVLSSSQTGSENGFRITAADNDGKHADGAGLSALAFDPPGGATGASLTQSAANAKATINGLSVSSASNTLDKTLQGLTLTLGKVTETPVQVNVAQDAAGTKAKIQGFVDAYNSLAKLLAADIKYDSKTDTAGVLQGDSTAVSLQRQLRNMVTGSSAASAAFSTLSQAGLEMQADGTLKINDTKLTSAMGKLPELKKLFANSDLGGQGANDGFALRLRKLSDAMLSTDGSLTTRSDGLTTSLTANSKNQDVINQRLSATEARLRAQYTALDNKMATLTTLSAYMNQQVANWNKSRD